MRIEVLRRTDHTVVLGDVVHIYYQDLKERRYLFNPQNRGFYIPDANGRVGYNDRINHPFVSVNLAFPVEEMLMTYNDDSREFSLYRMDELDRIVSEAGNYYQDLCLLRDWGLCEVDIAASSVSSTVATQGRILGGTPVPSKLNMSSANKKHISITNMGKDSYENWVYQGEGAPIPVFVKVIKGDNEPESGPMHSRYFEHYYRLSVQYIRKGTPHILVRARIANV